MAEISTRIPRSDAPTTARAGYGGENTVRYTRSKVPQSFSSARYTVMLTTLASVAPPAIRMRSMFASVRRVCASTSPATISPVA